jgi:hypothetical protein
MVNNQTSRQSKIYPSKRIEFSPKFLLLASLLVLLTISLSGCVNLNDPEASQEYNADGIRVIDARNTLGQSLVSRRPHLNGITIWLTTRTGQSDEPNQPAPNIKLDLYHSLGESIPLYSTSLGVPASADNTSLSIPIPDQKNAAGQPFYIQLSSETSPIQINGRLEDAYPYGQVYSNGSPINADIAFRLSYEYDLSAFFQDLKLFIGDIWLVIPLIILLWLPGWLLLDISRLRIRFDLGEQTAISIGLSLAVIPLVMLCTTVLNLHWSSNAALFSAGFLLALFIVRIIYCRIISRKQKSELFESQSEIEPDPARRLFSWFLNPSFLFTMIFLGSLAIRLIMVRDLATPAWVDSVHHALITRLILENGSYPGTYLPNLNISATTYHAGFHSIAAFFTWLSQLDLARSLLILGQVLNAFAVFSVYLLTKTLTRSSVASLCAAFITGFLTPMPAYYTSWGRYTELTGLLIFPVALALIQSWHDHAEDKKTIWTILLAAITAGGLFMIHYRVVVFLACLLIAYFCAQLLTDEKITHCEHINLLLLILAVAGLGIVLVLPWFIPTLKNLLLPKLAVTIENSTTAFADFSWPYLNSALGKQALVLAGLGLAWSLIKKRGLAILIILWITLLFFLANLDAFKLPGSGLITNISVEIILFIPISVLGGYFIEQLVVNWKQLLPTRFFIPASSIMIIIFSLIAYLGAKQLIPIINPVTILSRQADLPAIQWVEDHIPKNEIIAINPFSWGYGLYAGNDGGYWIEALSDKLTLPPPVLYGLGPGYKVISHQSQQLISLSNDPAALHAYLLTQDIHYIFIGARGGVFPPEKLVSSGLFETLYHQDGSWILAVKP